MKKKILVALFISIFIPKLLSAQHVSVQRHELILSYGNEPITDFINTYSNIFTTLFFDGNVITRNEKYSGAFNLGYIYYINKWFGLGGSYSYARIRQDVLDKSDNTVLGKDNFNYHTFMPIAKFSWFKRNAITLYSKLGAGVVVAQLKETDSTTKNKDKKTDLFFAFQASPLGIEIGKEWAGFAELGIGQQGLLQLGIRYRF